MLIKPMANEARAATVACRICLAADCLRRGPEAVGVVRLGLGGPARGAKRQKVNDSLGFDAA